MVILRIGTAFEHYDVLNKKMKKTILTICIFFTGLIALADGTGNDSNKSEVKPNASITQNAKSFNVGGLKACTVEFDDSDAVVEYIAQAKAETKITSSTGKKSNIK